MNAPALTPDRKPKYPPDVILDAIVEGICGVNARGDATFCNEAFLRMTGYGKEEVIGRNVHELLHHSRPDGTPYPVDQCALTRAIKTGQAVSCRVDFFWRKDRTCIVAEYWIRPLEQPWGSTHYVGTVKDITEIQRTKEVLRDREEKFRRILANSLDIAWTSNRHGRTRYVSPKVEEVLGYTSAEVYAGATHLWLHPWRPKRVPMRS